MPWPCGAADFVRQLSCHLIQAGHEVAVLTSNTRAALSGEEGVRLKIIPGDWNLIHLWKVSGWVKEQHFDLVDLQYESAMYADSGKVLFLPLLLRKRKLPVVLTLHSQALPRWGGRFWRLLQVFYYDALIFYSGSLIGNMKRRFPRKARFFHFQGFPSNILRSVNPSLRALVGKVKGGWSGTPLLMIYFGHIAPRRGLEDMIECLKILKAKGLTPQLALASQFVPEEDLYHRDLLSLLKAEGLQDQVSFTGRLGDRQVSDLFQAADLCVLPFPEGASLKNGSLAAAIEHEVPTVSTATSLTEPELLQGGALRTYPPGDRKRLAEAIEELLISEGRLVEIRKKMGALKDLISWEAYIQKRLEIYKSLINRLEAVSDVHARTCSESLEAGIK